MGLGPPTTFKAIIHFPIITETGSYEITLQQWERSWCPLWWEIRHLWLFGCSTEEGQSWACCSVLCIWSWEPAPPCRSNKIQFWSDSSQQLRTSIILTEYDPFFICLLFFSPNFRIKEKILVSPEEITINYEKWATGEKSRPVGKIELAHLARREERWGCFWSIRRRFRHCCVSLYYRKMMGFCVVVRMWKGNGYFLFKRGCCGCGRWGNNTDQEEMQVRTVVGEEHM